MPNVKEGNYTARAVPQKTEDGPKYAQLGLSKNSGTKQVLMMFQIESGPFKGETLPWFGYFTKDAAKRTVESLRLCGLKGQDIFAVESQRLDNKVSITVEVGEYEGKTRSRVAWVNDPNYVMQIDLQPMVDDSRTDLADMVGDLMAE